MTTASVCQKSTSTIFVTLAIWRHNPTSPMSQSAFPQEHTRPTSLAYILKTRRVVFVHPYCTNPLFFGFRSFSIRRKQYFRSVMVHIAVSTASQFRRTFDSVGPCAACYYCNIESSHKHLISQLVDASCSQCSKVCHRVVIWAASPDIMYPGFDSNSSLIEQ